MNSVFNIDYRT